MAICVTRICHGNLTGDALILLKSSLCLSTMTFILNYNTGAVYGSIVLSLDLNTAYDSFLLQRFKLASVIQLCLLWQVDNL